MMYKYMTLDEIKPFEGLMRDLGVSKVSRGVTPKARVFTDLQTRERRS